MPIGKDIYDVLSKNYSKRRKNKEELRKKELDKNKRPKAPALVDNFKVGAPRVARSLNIQPIEDVKQRKISPDEGKPVVNANTDVKKFIHPPKAMDKHPLNQPEAGVINPKNIKSRRKSNVKQTGKNKY